MRTLIILSESPSSDPALKYFTNLHGIASPGSTIMAYSSDEEGDQPANTDIKNKLPHGHLFESFQIKLCRELQNKEIIKEVIDGKYDLLVMKSENGKRTSLMHKGDHISEIADHVPCSILIVKEPISPIKRILFCDSGSEESEALRDITVRLIKLLNSLEQLTVLHVMSQVSAGPGILGEQLRSDAENLISAHSPEGKLLQRDIKELGLPGISPVPKIRHGLVVDEILDESQAGEYDLVIIGAHKSVGWQKVLLDNLARKILSQIDRSLLIIKSSPDSLLPG